MRQTAYSFIHLPLYKPKHRHLQSSVLFLLFAPLLLLLPPLLLFVHLLLDVLQPLALLLLLLLLLHGGEQLLRALHQPLVLCVDLFPSHRRGLRLERRSGARSRSQNQHRLLKCTLSNFWINTHPRASVEFRTLGRFEHFHYKVFVDNNIRWDSRRMLRPQ